MKKKLLFLIWASLVVLVLSTLTVVGLTSRYEIIGKDFQDTNQFNQALNRFYDEIGPRVLNPLDLEEAKDKLPVSADEIKSYRTHYGSMTEQMKNIQYQYEDQIAEAKELDHQVLLETLKKERDQKIAEVQKNFESDEYVAKKIRKKKIAFLEKYIENLRADESYARPFVYELKNVETGEIFTKGKLVDEPTVEIQFNEENGYLEAHAFLSADLESYYQDNGIVSLTQDDLQAIAPSKELFEGVVQLTPATFSKLSVRDYFVYGSSSNHLKVAYESFMREKFWLYVFMGLSGLALVLLFTVLRFQKEWALAFPTFIRWYQNWKIDLKIVLFLVALMICFSYLQIPFFYNSMWFLGDWIQLAFGFLIFGTLPLMLLVFQVVYERERWQQGASFVEEFSKSYTAFFFRTAREMFLNRSIGMQATILLVGFFLAGFGLAIVFIEPILFFIYGLCVLLLGLPALYLFVTKTAYLNKIMHATALMATGQLNAEIPVKGRSAFAKHAENLNNLREGVRKSLTEQAKSERLKTELITNVSHDLRTPLTSIITYTDLLKDETLSAEERAKYIAILDQKSSRLKTLIEDLFDVSKMASGNLELQKQKVDLTQLLQQALGEHEESIAQSGLDFRTTYPQEPLIAYIDGKRWWRVLDNLINNAIKYSLPGTRVYLTLRQVGHSAEFVIKNITKYELGDNLEELFERFKRGDESRHTDGSGLGLAIAQSIVDMHHGTMKIDLDGDLFKVTVTVPLMI